MSKKIFFYLFSVKVLILLYIIQKLYLNEDNYQLATNAAIRQNRIDNTSLRFDQRYPSLLRCYNKGLKKWHSSTKRLDSYANPASNQTHNARFIRALVLYFPVDRKELYQIEFKWLYRSWIEMQQYEPPKWRTDLILFVQADLPFLTELNCSFAFKRRSDEELPLCTLIQYVPLNNRTISTVNSPNYDDLLQKINIFSNNSIELAPFYSLLKKSVVDYNYLDSIMVAFEGFEYFKSAGYDFLIRSDMDVFLTPLFAQWLPDNCNDFYVGRGGYSDAFNDKRFRRIASNLKLEYAGMTNLGSTWYSTPDQFRLVSYLTLFGIQINLNIFYVSLYDNWFK